jgi:hypothetical protein
LITPIVQVVSPFKPNLVLTPTAAQSVASAPCNAEHWNGRKLPNYSASHIPIIRKKMTHTWVTSVKNTVKWKAIIMKKK